MPICPEGHTSESDDYCDTCGAPIDMSAQPTPPPAATPPAEGEQKPCPNCSAPNVTDALFCEACGYDFTTGTMPRTSVLTIGTSDWRDPNATADDVPPADATDTLPAAEDDDRPDETELGDEPDPAQPEALPEETAAQPDEAEPEPEEHHEPQPVQPVVEPQVDQPAPADTDDEAAVIGTDEQAAVLPSSADTPGTLSTETEWVAEVWIDPDWYAVQQSSEQLPSPGLPTIVPLRKRRILIGRPSRSRGIIPDIDCESDSGCSRRHAELSTDGTRWWVEDLGSSNGTYIGAAGEPLPEQPLPAGRRELREDDRIYLGAWTRIVIRQATPDEQEL